MVKQTQTIRQQFADELFVFDHFKGLALKGLKESELCIKNDYNLCQITTRHQLEIFI